MRSSPACPGGGQLGGDLWIEGGPHREHVGEGKRKENRNRCCCGSS